MRDVVCVLALLALGGTAVAADEGAAIFDGKTLTGLVVAGASGETVVVLHMGDRATLKANQVEGTRPSKASSMPDGLLDPLTLEEVADLFAYLQKSNKASSLTRRPLESAPK